MIPRLTRRLLEVGPQTHSSLDDFEYVPASHQRLHYVRLRAEIEGAQQFSLSSRDGVIDTTGSQRQSDVVRIVLDLHKFTRFIPSLLCRGLRHRGERRSPAHLASRPDTSAVAVNDPLHVGEPFTDALKPLRTMRPPTLPEQFIKMFVRVFFKVFVKTSCVESHTSNRNRRTPLLSNAVWSALSYRASFGVKP